MKNLREKLDKIINYHGRDNQENYAGLEQLEFNIALNEFRLFKEELNVLGESRYKLSDVIFNLIDELADVCVFDMQLKETDICESLEKISKQHNIFDFAIEHKQLIKERVLYKVDRTLERIANGYYKQV